MSSEKGDALRASIKPMGISKDKRSLAAILEYFSVGFRYSLESFLTVDVVHIEVIGSSGVTLSGTHRSCEVVKSVLGRLEW
jgi:hypothetical protein